MVFVLLGLLASCAYGMSANETFISELSLSRSHVGENGRNPHFVYSGAHAIITQSRDDHSQLGYLSSLSRGTVQTRDSLRHSHFKIEVDFSFSKNNGKGTAGFWISDELSTGTFYGRNKDYKGIGVLITEDGQLNASFVDSINNKPTKPIRVGKGNQLAKISIIKKGKSISAYIKVDGKEHLIYSGRVGMGKGMKFGISADSGTEGSPLSIYSISFFSFAGPKKLFLKGEGKKSNFFVCLAAVAGIIWLVYYLYTKQIKLFNQKE